VNILYLADITAKRVFDFNRNMKMIVVLRNPIDRAYSAYWYFKRNLWEKSETFEASLKREPEILSKGTIEQKCNLTPISHGFYFDQLRIFFQFFDRDQILILFFEELKNKPEKLFQRIYDFFGLPGTNPADTKKKYNVASRPKFLPLNKIIYEDNPIKSLYKRCVPEDLRNRIRVTAIKRIKDINQIPFKKPPMNTTTREKLREVFIEPNKKLEDFLQVDLSHWT
jgi:hypothetical protein